MNRSADAARIERDIAAISGHTESPEAGASRPTFSAAWRAARDYVESQLAACACKVRIDAAGNLHARPAAMDWREPAWLSGSHLDTVPHGGDFDGVTGVVVPLELLRAAHVAREAIPLELVVFAEEEGTTFGLGMAGSRAWTGGLSREQLASLKNADGLDYLTAGAPHGVNPDRLGDDRIDPSAYIGLVEVHIEQGPGMWKSGTPVAVVEAIAGRLQFRCALAGMANHAGSTSMRDRRDALAGAAETITALESLAPQLSPQSVATVGRIECHPNAVNVIPERVDFTIDFRTPDNALLDAGRARIEAAMSWIAARRGLALTCDSTERQPAVALDARVCHRLHDAAARAGCGTIPSTISGALHDAAIVAPHIPTAMLFVASRDGISHNPAEFSRIEDIATAARILGEAIRQGPLA